MASQLRSLPEVVQRGLLPLLMAISLLATSLAGISFAAHDDGLFELEGDATDVNLPEVPDPQVNEGGEDWDTYFSGSDPTFDETDGDALTGVFTMDAVGAADDALKTGGSKDINDLTEWQVDPDFSTPDKDDLDNAYALAYENADGDIIVYFGTDRFATEGDAKVGFWFLQGDFNLEPIGGPCTEPDPEDCGSLAPTTDHTDGDILIQSNFTNGGDVSRISVYEWQDGLSGGNDGPHGALKDHDGNPATPMVLLNDEDNLRHVEEGNECDTVGTHEACAIVNASAQVAPWPHQAKGSAVTNSFPPGSFFEGGLNLSDLLINAPATCFSTFMATTRSSQEPTAQLKDIVVESFDLCGGIDILKTDTSTPPNELSGAAFAVYDILDAAALELVLDGLEEGEALATIAINLLVDADVLDPIGTCTSDADSDDECSFDDLLPGDDRYLVVETSPPPGYDLSDPNWQIVTVERFKRTAVTFENPRLPYWIDVTPETDLNPVGLDHDFLVTARVGDEDTPVPDGTVLDLSWEVLDAADPFVGSITAIEDDDGTHDDLDLLAATCTTTTVTWNADSVTGACIVTVSSDATGSGTLVASLDLPYGDLAQAGSSLEGTNYNETTGEGDLVESIWDDGDKTWRGYDLTVDTDGDNLLGEAHTFTVSVSETGPGADTTPAGVIIVADWDGPAGSTVDGEGSTAVPAGITGDAACTTDDTGTCDFTVDSDTNIGTGTLTVVAIVGQIGAHEVEITSFPDATDTDMEKNWRQYRLWVTPQTDINQVGWEHTFTVHVQQNLGEGAGWTDVEGATFSTDDWDFTGDAAVLGDAGWTTDGSDCASGTDSSGECDITATSDVEGDVLLTISGVTVPFDGGDDGSANDHLDIGDTALVNGDGGDNDNTGAKTWVDYGVIIGDDGVNLMGDAHPFVVTVTRSDIGALEGATVNLTWDGPSGSTIAEGTLAANTVIATDDDAGTGGQQISCTTDADGKCFFVVDSDSSFGEGTLSVTSVTDPSVTDGEGAEEITASVTFEAGEKDTAKEWVAFDVDITPDGVNLVDDEHDFVVTATRYDDGGASDATGTIDLTWDGPTGSTVYPTGDSGNPYTDGDAGADGVQFTCTLSDGQCLISVNSPNPGEGTLTATSLTSDDPFTVDLTGADSGQHADLSFPVDADKLWLAVDVDISGDATNLLPNDPNHAFTVTARIDSGSGLGSLDSDSLTWSLSPAGHVGSVDLDLSTCDDGGTGADGTCTIVVTSTDPGQITVTIDSITFTWDSEEFTVDLESGASGHSDSLDLDVEATKTWVDYALSMTPQEATNLLPSDPEHLITVTLDSSDEDGAAPVAGQTLELTLTSDNGATIIEVVDDNGSTEHDPGVTSTTCVTDADGQCDVWISADTSGHATLNASYDIYIDAVLVDTIDTSEFPAEDNFDDTQDADKVWTTFLVDVNGPAINLLGTPHTFTVTVCEIECDEDGFVQGAVFGTDVVEDDSYITISSIGDVASIDGGTCFTTGTNSDGECTVIVSSTATTIATVTANYLGTASDSDAAFFDDGNTKQWIDYTLDVTPNADDNLVDTPHVFTVSVSVDLGKGDGWQALPEGETADVSLAGVGTITSIGAGGSIAEDGLSGTCVLVPNGDDTASTCEVTITSSVAGESELTATYVGVAQDGDLVNVEESDVFTDDPAEKNWVDYNLVLNEDAVNPIGTTHTFTATLTKATTSDEGGSIFEVAANEELVFSIAGVGTVIDVIDGTVDEDGRGGVCTTDANGQCDIIIQSDEVGQTTVTAEYFAEVGDTTGTFSDEAVKTWVSNPAISLVKTGSTTEAELGELVTYTYLITNTGDVRLDFVTLDDEIEISGLFADLLNLLLPSAGLSLEPGESVEFESSYLVTSDDFPGPIDNVAETTGTAPDGEVVRDDDDWSVTVLGNPAIELIKAADIVPDASGFKSVTILDPTDPGATTIEYTYTVTNVGNVPLSNLTLTDYVLSEVPDNPIGDYSYDEALAAFDGTLITVDLPVDTLAPGETTVGVATFSVRDIDVANALINNVAEVNGTDAAGTTVSADDDETVFVTVVLGVVIEKPPLPATGISAFELLMYGLLAGGLGLILVYVLPQAPVVARRREED